MVQENMSSSDLAMYSASSKGMSRSGVNGEV